MIEITANFKGDNSKVLHDVKNLLVDFKPIFSYDNDDILNCKIETDKDIRITHTNGILVIAKNTLESLEITTI